MADSGTTRDLEITTSTPPTSKRVKERRQYTEDCLQDEEIEGKRMFSVDDKLASSRFGSFFVQEMTGEDFNLKYLQRNGFESPVVIKDKTGLGMRMPSSNFTVNDVKQCVGSRRLLDVMDVTTQKDIEMSMKDWCRYFEGTNRDKLLNVISLEFSHTKLENYVESPAVVRQVDWVDLVWPRHLKESQIEGTNVIEEMKYPKVQKYCLMSVKGCYTDFHVDFGGTSVWYHIMRGAKVFWLIPPTERNLQLYEQWVLSGKQGDIFFGDTVEKCARVHLHAGYTFFIPTGWIHAVFTPEDSLVFGGNFLHSFGMQKQIRIVEVEDITHVPVKFRYPFYTEIMWYALQRYVYCLLGKNHLSCNENGDQVNMSEWPPDKGKVAPSTLIPLISDLSEEKKENVLEKETNPLNGFNISTSGGTGTCGSSALEDAGKLDVGMEGEGMILNAASPPKQHIHLSKVELSGLKVMVEWLQRLPSNKRNLPDLIKDAEALIADVRILLKEHLEDEQISATTGKPSLFWTMTPKKRPKPRPNGPPSGGGGVSKGGGKSGSKSNSNSSARRRRTRCKKCEACLRADCGDCHFCKDMKKFGGPGRMKQSCISRQCMAPVLPHTACCMLCGRDGWEKVNNPQENEVSSLMECSQCWEIVHPACLKDHNQELPLEGMTSDDLPNSWECPRCLRDGKPDTVKPRYVKPSKGTPSALHTAQPVAAANMVVPESSLTAAAAVGSLLTTAQPPIAHLSSSVPHSQAIAGTPGVCDLSMGGTAGALTSTPSAPVPPLAPKSLLLGNIVSSDVKARNQASLQQQHHHSVKEEELSDGENRLVQQPIPKKIKIDRFHGCIKQESPSEWFQQQQNDHLEEGSKDQLAGGILRSTGQMLNQHHRALHVQKRTSESSEGERDEASPPEVGQLLQLSNAHVRTCSRFSLEGSPVETPANEITLKIPKLQSGQELRSPKPSSRPTLTSLSSSRKHGETARERLFRNLKGLKKNSNELSSVRHSILRVKTKALGDNNNICSPRSKEQQKDLPLKILNSGVVVKKERDCSRGTPHQQVAVHSSLFIVGQEDSKEDTKLSVAASGDKTERQENKDDSGQQPQPPVPSSPNNRFNMTLRDKSNLRKPKYVVRPAPVLEETKREKQKASGIPMDNLALEKEVILPVFHFLTSHDLLSCQLVCRSWNRWCVDPRLWTYMDLSRRKITANILMGVVRRQPLTLNLSWTNISKRQLSWLITRLPQLKDLVLSGCAAVAVSALCSSGCPLLRSLDLCWTEGLVDSIIRDLLSPPSDSRPGFVEAKTRLRQLMEVRVAGADISDVSVRLLAHHLPLLCRLDLSHCHKVTDMGIAVLGAAKAARLSHLDVSSCSNISDTSLEALKRCSNLMLLDMRECPQVADTACQKFVSHLRYSMTLKDGKFMERKS